MRYLWLCCLLLIADVPYCEAVERVVELPTFTMDASNVSPYVTPVAYRNGVVYTANVEPGKGLGIPRVNLHTVVRKCAVGSGSNCSWESKVVDDATLDDMYHTQPSIALDRRGHIHVAYNMHHMPWQYSVSTSPADISAFSFRGEHITLVEKSTVKLLNKTPFPSVGKAAIPGNQITYAAFYNDRNGDLFATYRSATRPKRGFSKRAYAGAIASYNNDTRKWIPLGGDLLISFADADISGGLKQTVIKPFALEDSWQPQPIRLAFDRANGLHAAWVWREQRGAFGYANVSYAFSDDSGTTFRSASGRKYSLPITMPDVEKPFAGHLQNLQVSGAVVHTTVDTSGQPYVVAAVPGVGNVMTYFDHETHRWSEPENLPLNAVRFEIDDNGTQWVFATGLKVLRRDKWRKSWKTVYADTAAGSYGWPKVLAVPNERLFVVHTISTIEKKVKIYLVKY